MLVHTLLKNAKVRIRDVASVEQKLTYMVNAGINNLLVISDFDYTLSCFHDAEGKSCWTTHGVLDVAAFTLSQELGNVLKKLKEKFLPIEFDPHMTVSEKMPHMEEWWKTSHQCILKACFTKHAIQKFVGEAKLELKEGAREMILALNDRNIPLIIFSAGLGNVIDLFLQNQFGQLPRNLHIISNMMKFDENDVAVSFIDPVIHTFNKNSSVISHSESLYNEVSYRTCVLLMGDSLGDLHMDVGLEDEQVALKIGFLNYDGEELQNKYLDGYDIVLLDDQTMRVPQLILNYIFEGDSDGNSLTSSTCVTCRLESETKLTSNSDEDSKLTRNVQA